MAFDDFEVKRVQAQRMSLDGLIVSTTQLEILSERIEANGYPVPDSIKAQLTEEKRELDHRIRGDKLRKLQQLKLQRSQLLSRSDKLKDAEAEIAALESELGPEKATPAKKGGE